MQLNSIKDTQPVSSQKITSKKEHSDKTYSNRILYRLKKRKSPFPNSGVVSRISNFIYSSLLDNLFDPTNRLSEDFLKKINILEWNYPFLNVDKIIQDYLKEIVINITEKQIQLKDNDDLKKMKEEYIVAIGAKIEKEKENKKSLQNILSNFLSTKLDTFIKQFQKKGVFFEKNNFQKKYDRWIVDIFNSKFFLDKKSVPFFNFKNEIEKILLQLETKIIQLNEKPIIDSSLKVNTKQERTNDYDDKVKDFEDQLDLNSISLKLKKAFTRLLVQEIQNDIANLPEEENEIRLPTIFFKELQFFVDSTTSLYNLVIPNILNSSQKTILESYGLSPNNFKFKTIVDKSDPKKILLNLDISLNIDILNDRGATIPIDVEFWSAHNHLIIQEEEVKKKIKEEGLFSNFLKGDVVYQRDIVGSPSGSFPFENLRDLFRISLLEKKTKNIVLYNVKIFSRGDYFIGKTISKDDTGKTIFKDDNSKTIVQTDLDNFAKLLNNTYGIGKDSKDKYNFMLGVHFVDLYKTPTSIYLNNEHSSSKYKLVKLIFLPNFFKNELYVSLKWNKKFVFEIEEIYNELKKPENEIKFRKPEGSSLLLTKKIFEGINDGTQLFTKQIFEGINDETQEVEDFYSRFTNWKEVIDKLKKSNKNINWDKYSFSFQVNKKLHTIDVVIKTSDVFVPRSIKKNKRISINNDVIKTDDKWVENLKKAVQMFQDGFVKFKLKSETNELKTLLQKWNLQFENYLKSTNQDINSLISPKKIEESILYKGLEPLVPTSNPDDSFENFMKNTIKYESSSMSIVIPGETNKEKMISQNRNLRLTWVWDEYSLKDGKKVPKKIVIEVPLVSSKVSPFLSNKNLQQKGQEAQGKIKDVLDKIKQNPEMYQKLLSQFPELKSKLQKMQDIFKFLSQARGKNNKIKITKDQLKNLEELLKANIEELHKKLPELFLGSKIINNLTKAFKGQIPKVVWKFIEKYPNIVRELANSQLDYSTIAKMLGSKKMRRHLTSFTNWKNILPKAEIIAKNYKYAYLASATGLGVAGITSSVVSLSGALKRIKKNKSGIYFSRFVVSITAIVGVSLILISSALFIFFFLKQGGWNT